jgi:hypothetical protein
MRVAVTNYRFDTGKPVEMGDYVAGCGKAAGENP